MCENTVNKIFSLWGKCAVYFLCHEFFYFSFQKTNRIRFRVSLTLSVLKLKPHVSDLMKAWDLFLDSVPDPCRSHYTLPNISALYSSLAPTTSSLAPRSFLSSLISHPPPARSPSASSSPPLLDLSYLASHPFRSTLSLHVFLPCQMSNIPKAKALKPHL